MILKIRNGESQKRVEEEDQENKEMKRVHKSQEKIDQSTEE